MSSKQKIGIFRFTRNQQTVKRSNKETYFDTNRSDTNSKISVIIMFEQNTHYHKWNKQTHDKIV